MTVTLTINGIQVSVSEQSTILEAAQVANVTIPALCHHPDLTDVGACRLCVVSVEGARGLQTACTTPVVEGMVVETESAEARAARTFVLEMLLTDHPNDCMTCEADGDCELQRWAYEYDVAYPFTLTTGRVLYHWHGGAQSRRSEALMALHPEPLVEIHPDDASRLDIAEGEAIRVTSRRGAFVARAWLTERVAPGLIFGTFHFPEGNVNWATGAFLDPMAKIPEYKVSAVRVEKVAGQ